MKIGQRIRQIRRQKELSQDYIAERVGITNAYVSRIENGHNDPDSELLKKFAEAMDVSPRDFFDEVDEEPKSVNKPKRGYRVVATVPAGRGALTDRQESYEEEHFDYDPDTHFVMEVSSITGESMAPFLRPGDKVLASLNGKARPGDLVVAVWNSHKDGAIKLFNEMDGIVVLKSINYAFDDIFLKKNEVKLYPIVNIKKFNKGK